MKKTLLLILASLLLAAPVLAEAKIPFGYNLEDDINRNNPDYYKNKEKKTETKEKKEEKKEEAKTVTNEVQYFGNGSADWENQTSFYPNATLNSAIQKYKKGNYSGTLQELVSVAQKDSSNPLLYYYLGMTYTQIGNKDQAINAYERVMKINSDRTLTQYATRGRDCLVYGPSCAPPPAEDDKEMDSFINSPYGNGLSDQVNKEMKEQQLKNIQKTINTKNNLDDDELQKIQNFDNSSSIDTEDKIAVSNEDVLNAIETLKKAGVTVSINPYQQNMMMPNNEYAQLGMLLGNNNNNNSASSMMNMLPYMMSQQQNGKNLDPQIFQSMMMNSMIPDFTFNDKKDY